MGRLSTCRVGEMGILSVEEIGVGEMGDTPQWGIPRNGHEAWKDTLYRRRG